MTNTGISGSTVYRCGVSFLVQTAMASLAERADTTNVGDYFQFIEELLLGETTLPREDVPARGDPLERRISGLFEDDLNDGRLAGAAMPDMSRLSMNVTTPTAATTTPPREGRGGAFWTPPYPRQPSKKFSVFHDDADDSPSGQFAASGGREMGVPRPSHGAVHPHVRAELRQLVEAHPETHKQELLRLSSDPMATAHHILRIDRDPEAVLRETVGSTPGLLDAMINSRHMVDDPEHRRTLDDLIKTVTPKSQRRSRAPLRQMDGNTEARSLEREKPPRRTTSNPYAGKIY